MGKIKLGVALLTLSAIVVAIPAGAMAQERPEVALGASAYADEVIADEAIAYWRLGESSGTVAADSAGSHVATYEGTPTLGATGLLSTDSDTAAGFGGVDDRIAVADATGLNLGGPFLARSVELWFNADEVSSRQVLYEQGGTGRGISMYLDGGKVYMGAWNTNNDGPTTPWGPVWVSTSVNAGQTYHVVLVFDQAGDSLEGYLNGVSFDSVSSVGELHGHAANVGIASMDHDTRFHDGAVSNTGTNYFFDGVLDEVAVYDTALSSTQIASHRTTGGGTLGVAPIVDIVDPRAGDTVGGTVPILIDATDDLDAAGSLTVEWRAAGSDWAPATYNVESGYYEANWDSTVVPNGPRAIRARATDSTAQSTTDQIAVTLFNPSAYAGEVEGDGAFAYWRFSESFGSTAADEVGSYVATYKGGPSRGVAGLISSDPDTAVGLDGVNDRVEIADATGLNLGGPFLERSIELWFNADDVTSRQVLYEQGGTGRGMTIYVEQGSVHMGAWNTNNDDATTPWGPVWVSAPVSAATRYHVVLVFDHSAGLEGFVNGESIGSATAVGKLFGHAANAAIGAMDHDTRFADGPVSNSGTGYYFDGRIDEVALYATALNPTQIGSHAVTGGLSVPIAPSVSILDPTAGDTVGGQVPIVINAFDDVDPTATLNVEWRAGGSPWATATYNSETGYFEALWDSTVVANGARAVKARATDSSDLTSTDNFAVTVDNPSDYAAEVILDGAFAYWRLGESSGTAAADEVGSHVATYKGLPSRGSAGLLSPDPDNAVGFDGINDRVAVADATTINTGGPYAQRSIELWFKADDVSSRQVLYEQGGTVRGMSIYIDQGKVYMGAWNTTDNDVTTPWSAVWVSTPVEAATTYHLVMVFDKSVGIEGYLNGVSVGSVAGVGNLFSHAADIGIGAMIQATRFHDGTNSSTSHSYHFAGTIDEVALYATPLTPSQVASHATLGGQ